jgi:predicted DNA binding CopG/RHH family protein
MSKVKGISLLILVLVLASIIVVLKEQYFPTQKPEPRQDQLFASFEKLNQDFSQGLEGVKQSSKAIRDIISYYTKSTSTQVRLSQDEIIAIQRELSKKTKTKSLYNNFFQDLKDALPSGWTYEIVVPTKQNTENNLILSLDFSSSVSCEVCIDELCSQKKSITSSGNFFVYSSENTQDLIQNVEKIKQERFQKQCLPEIFLQTEKYVVINECSNNTQCNNYEPLLESLTQYFEK